MLRDQSFFAFIKEFKMETITAILVDGGFYRKQAKKLFGEKTPQKRAEELILYCRRHLKSDFEREEKRLYRIFYYDCPPSEKTIYNPLTQRSVNLGSSAQYRWTNDFFEDLSRRRKVALRMGELLESKAGYSLNYDALKKLLRKEITVDDLTENDLTMDIQQKGVDMRIGLDIASLANKKLVNQIVLIAGDSDFVPAAKHARREGIDFILDPMWHPIKPSLLLHIDGKEVKTGKPGHNYTDRLCFLTPPTDNDNQNNN